MKKTKLTISLLILLSIISGCAAIGIPDTPDPIEKLKWADAALRSGRPLPAKKMIEEAIPLLEQESSYGMLGGAYNVFGRLEYGFPKGNDRNYYYAIMNFDKSLNYIEKILNEKGLDKNDKYYSTYLSWGTNSAFCLGELYQVNKSYLLSCYYFDKSYGYYSDQLKLEPEAKIPAVGFKDFEEAIEKNKKWSNCISIQSKPTFSVINETIVKTQQALFDETHPKATKKNNIDSEIEHYLSQLSSNDTGKRIFILKTIFKDEITDNRVFFVINEMLGNKNIQESMSNIEADEISWMCKALASSGRREYEDTIKIIYVNARDNKVKRYAYQSLDILENFSIRNRDILQQVQK